MLLNLKIRDFAIIDAVEFELRPGFTVVTGETGAGKSILVNALVLVLGGRATTEVIRSGAETAEVEALFDISAHPLVRARLEQRELVGDDPGMLLVRRMVGSKGKAKVVVNGRLATVATLGEIVRGLVDISGQHEQQSLLVVDNHLDILDAYGNLDALKSAFREAYDAWRRAERERDQLAGNEQERLREADYLRFQLDEIERLDPQPGELDTLGSERQRLAHADRLKRGAGVAEALLYGEDGSAFDKLGKASAEVEALARIDAELTGVTELLAGARRDIQEASRTLQRYVSRIEADPARLGEVDERLNELKRVGRKHGGGIEELLSRRASLKAQLDGVEHADARLAELAAEVESLRTAAVQAAEELCVARARCAQKLSLAVEAEVADIDLAGATFRVEVTRGGELAAHGFDKVEFLWSANRGEEPRALARIASGGELSRLMLAVKRVLSSRDLVSLYVFDEVDTGLGGRAADSIGRKIEDVARNHQAITITHLAPIAARADQHLVVRKESHGQRTVSVVEEVRGAARAEEVARMIDGAHISPATRAAAREMLARD
ncbi:MAG: DNA repair protein RecN [Deltaproteobacteria bacterium]|nr:DNA repair protein RecN [Deltaproteobacteria bacterium]